MDAGQLLGAALDIGKALDPLAVKQGLDVFAGEVLNHVWILTLRVINVKG